MVDERALKYFTEAWNRIKAGDFFDEDNNHAFDYMLRNLWASSHHAAIKHDLVKHIQPLFAATRALEQPPPFIYILIGLKDSDINNRLITEAIIDFVKSNASETATYQLLHLLNTMSEKAIPLGGFIAAITKSIKTSMQPDMLEALAHMITIQHPEFMRPFLVAFTKLPNKTILRNFVNMGGRSALLQLLHIMTPGEVQKLMKS